MSRYNQAWPSLPLTAWQATLDTFHMYAQIAGKIRLHFAPPEPEWAHVALYVTARGLTTSPIPCDDRGLQIDFDLIEHRVNIATSDGGARTIELIPRSVADFYRELMQALAALDIRVSINTMPQEVQNPVAFELDTTHASYDRTAVQRFFQVLSQVDAVMKKHRAPYRARHTPVHFFWGSFDLSYARFTGKPATPPPNSNLIMRRSMDAEEINVGFWPGDSRFPEAALFAYVYPKPHGIESAAVKPSAAFWNKEIGEFMLRYEDVRQAGSPDRAMLDFLQSTYEAGVKAAGWQVPE